MARSLVKEEPLLHISHDVFSLVRRWQGGDSVCVCGSMVGVVGDCACLCFLTCVCFHAVLLIQHGGPCEVCCSQCTVSLHTCT